MEEESAFVALQKKLQSIDEELLYEEQKLESTNNLISDAMKSIRGEKEKLSSLEQKISASRQLINDRKETLNKERLHTALLANSRTILLERLQNLIEWAAKHTASHVNLTTEISKSIDTMRGEISKNQMWYEGTMSLYSMLEETRHQWKELADKHSSQRKSENIDILRKDIEFEEYCIETMTSFLSEYQRLQEDVVDLTEVAAMPDIMEMSTPVDHHKIEHNTPYADSNNVYTYQQSVATPQAVSSRPPTANLTNPTRPWFHEHKRRKITYPFMQSHDSEESFTSPMNNPASFLSGWELLELDT
jgi:hypothetical protein